VEQLTLPLFATVESQVQNKKTTCKDKSLTCNLFTQTQKLSKISVADSTSKEKACVPYWTDFCKDISLRLLLPVETDYADSDSSLYSIWSNKTVEKSWFSTKLYTVRKQSLQPIFSASSQLPKEAVASKRRSARTRCYSLVGCTDLESTVRKSKKIKICLNPVQKNLIKRWVGTSRFVFNEAVKYLQQPNTKANWKAIKTEIIHSLPEWSKEIPYQIKSIARKAKLFQSSRRRSARMRCKDACLAVKAAKKKFKQTGKIQKVKFRSRKDKIQSCYIPKSAVTDKGIYYTKLGSIRYTEKLPSKLRDCRLVSKNGVTYLCVPHEVLRQPTDNQGRVVALDPGVRSFMTFFSENSFGWLGQNDIGRIQRLCYYLDDLISRTAKVQRVAHKGVSRMSAPQGEAGTQSVRAKKRYRMRKAADRIRLKIRNLVDELHHQVARFLVDNFDIILLPTFETSQMAIKKSRKIRSKTVRQMLTFSHYRFKQFLKHKAFETGKLVLDVNEAYTSKTVSWTGEIIQNLGGRKKIKSSDGRVMDRDLNGGRGIFLRSLVDIPSLKDCIVNVS